MVCAVESFAVAFALVGHFNKLACVDNVPTRIHCFMLAINFLGNQPLLYLGTAALQCVRVSLAVGNPQAMIDLGLVRVVACVRVGNFDPADMARVDMRSAGDGHNSHCLSIVHYRVECRIIELRVHSLVLKGSCLLVKRDSHFKLPFTKESVCECTLEPVKYLMCRAVSATADEHNTVAAVLGMKLQNRRNGQPPQNNFFMTPI